MEINHFMLKVTGILLLLLLVHDGQANENFSNCINLSVSCSVWTVKIENYIYNIDNKSSLEESYCKYYLTIRSESALAMSESSSSYSSLISYQCYNNKTNIENCTMYKDFLNSRLCFNVLAFMERYGNQSTICIQRNTTPCEKTFSIGINSTHVYILDSMTTTNIIPSPSSSSQDSSVNSEMSSTISSTMSSVINSTTPGSSAILMECAVTTTILCSLVAMLVT